MGGNANVNAIRQLSNNGINRQITYYFTLDFSQYDATE